MHLPLAHIVPQRSPIQEGETGIGLEEPFNHHLDFLNSETPRGILKGMMGLETAFGKEQKSQGSSKQYDGVMARVMPARLCSLIGVRV